MNLFKLKNPLPEQVRDTYQLTSLFRKLDLIPYYGTDEYTSHSFLQLIYELTRLSPSHNAAMKGKIRYAFKGNLDIKHQQIAGFADNEQRPVERTDKIKFLNVLKKYGITLPLISELTIKKMRQFWDNGNDYLRVKTINVGSTTRVYFNVDHYTQSAYLHNEAGQASKLVYSPIWDKSFMTDSKNKRKIKIASSTQYLEDFNISKRGSKDWETVIHSKNDIGISPFYGRTELEAAMCWMFVEAAQGNLNCKISSTDIISRHLFAFKAPAGEAKKDGKSDRKKSFHESMNVLRKLATSEGEEAHSIVGMEVPHNTDFPEKFDLVVNRSEKYNDWVLNKASQIITSLHNWDRELTGELLGKAGIGADTLINKLIVKDTDVIKPLQEELEAFWTYVFTQLSELLNEPILAKYTIAFSDKVQPTIDRIKEMNKGVSVTKGETQEEEEEPKEGKEEDDTLKFQNLKSKLDAYGVGVRAGAITPTIEDEISLRKDGGYPEITDKVKKAWNEEDGFRRPITLKSRAEQESEISNTETDEEE